MPMLSVCLNTIRDVYTLDVTSTIRHDFMYLLYTSYYYYGAGNN